jgi:glyoxylase-like metal-dependent hydrolase (beta-lactamase superfamily II)
MQIKTFFDPNTFTISYIIIDKATNQCAVIDSVLDYEIFSGKVSYQSADQIIAFIKDNNLQLEWILETHIHADHITAAKYLQKNMGGKIAIGNGIFEVLKYWVGAFNIEEELVGGAQFDYVFQDQEDFRIGNLEAKFINNPGHTPACGSYIIGNSVFVGDLIFMPNLGTGRTDFPSGSAAEQFNSIQKIFSLPEETKVFTGHDYPTEGDKPRFQSTIGEQKKENFLANISECDDYIKARESRDKRLAPPKLLFPAIQLNLRCGELPKPEKNGTQYLKIPLSFA